MTANLVCQNCRSELDAATPAVQVLARRARKSASTASRWRWAARHYRRPRDPLVLGAMLRVDDEGSRWTEYLLQSARRLFLAGRDR
jgi:hypothetical protein